jgi:hypothetical protein
LNCQALRLFFDKPNCYSIASRGDGKKPVYCLYTEHCIHCFKKSGIKIGQINKTQPGSCSGSRIQFQDLQKGAPIVHKDWFGKRF